MKKALSSILPILTIALVIAAVSGVASAQIGGPIGEEFTTNYYANNTARRSPSGFPAVHQPWLSVRRRMLHDLCL